MSIGRLTDTAQKRLMTMNNAELARSGFRLPYISLSGAKMSGPNAYPKTYMETVRASRSVLLEPNSAMTLPILGANMEEPKGL